MKRALLALAALLAIVAWLMSTLGSGAIERTHASDGTRDGVAPGSAIALASDAAPNDDARARIDDARLAPTTWRFEELVSVHSMANGESIAFDVQSYTSDGIRRAARSDDVVFARDVEPGGVWILSAPGHCPTWIAPEVYVELATIGREPPLLPLFAAATVVVRSSDGAPLPAGIDWLELTPAGNPLVLAQPIDGVYSVSRDFAVVGEGAAQQALHTGVDDVARAARHVRTLRDAFQREIDDQNTRFLDAGGRRLLAEGFAHGRDPSVNVVAYPPFGERVVIEHVKAGTVVQVRIGCAHLLQIEPVGERELTSRHAQSIADTEGFVLAQGEVLELRVRVVRGAVVRVRRPAAATGGPRFELERTAAPRGASPSPQAAFEVREPTPSADGTFEWSELPPGSYRLAATWVEAPDLYASATYTFELAEGEEHDLGVLAPHPEGRITLVPRLVAAEGAALPAVDLMSLVARVNLGRTDGSSSASRSFELVHGRPIVVAGLEPGDYTLRIVAVERADHGALIENAGGLTGADLIEALRRDLEASEVRLAASAAPIAVTVEGHTRVDVEVPIERSVP